MDFPRTTFAQFIASNAGRALRVVAGVTLIAGGLARRDRAGLLAAAVGLVPLSAGAFDLCLLSPLFGGPVAGAAIRDVGDRAR